ncbi:MAG: hypothetical protein NC177_07045 [Ruminococcus flavefaciens]|nr:hypothetical protein [Ruminococcus flavefaciens]
MKKKMTFHRNIVPLKISLIGNNDYIVGKIYELERDSHWIIKIDKYLWQKSIYPHSCSESDLQLYQCIKSHIPPCAEEVISDLPEYCFEFICKAHESAELSAQEKLY